MPDLGILEIVMAKQWTKETILAGVSLPGKMDDIPALKEELIELFLTKTHNAVSRYSVALAEHSMTITAVPRIEAFNEALAVNRAWQEGKASFQDARNVAGTLLAMARQEKDPVMVKVFRIMAQVANTPHVARHALIASDYAITLINVLYPQNYEEVRKERMLHNAFMQNA